LTEELNQIDKHSAWIRKTHSGKIIDKHSAWIRKTHSGKIDLKFYKSHEGNKARFRPGGR
jgi:hypothetical protein